MHKSQLLLLHLSALVFVLSTALFLQLIALYNREFILPNKEITIQGTSDKVVNMRFAIFKNFNCAVIQRKKELLRDY